MRCLTAIAVVALSAARWASAGESAVLASGFRIHSDAHQQRGDRVILRVASGEIEVAASDVVRFEQDDSAPPLPLPSAAQVPAQPAGARELITASAALTGIPEALVGSVARAESGLHVGAVSRKGALGLMQLMPGTAAGLHADPSDPAQNVYAGALYLRQLLLRYDGRVSKALAAYNAGPGAVDKYRGVPPYRETRNYVNRVLADYAASASRGK